MLKALIKLTRFEHALMLAFAVFIAEAIALNAIPPITLIIALSLLVPMLSEMGSFALNDYFDIETDKLNKKQGPLVTGKIKPSTALYFSIACLIASTAIAFTINSTVFAITLAFNLLGIAYNWKLKELPLVGNAYIALTMAIPFIFGNYVITTNISNAIIALALLGFVAGLAREIVKSIEDMEGDRTARKTLPLVIGAQKSKTIASLLYAAFLPLTAVPFTTGLTATIPALTLVILADLTIIYVISSIVKENYKTARNLSLLAFTLGMLGIFAAIL